MVLGIMLSEKIELIAKLLNGLEQAFFIQIHF